MPKDTRNWLLGADNPPVRYLTLRDLLGKSERSDEVRAARAGLMKYGVTRGILSHTEDLLEDAEKLKRVWGYDNLYWQVVFLGQFLADGKARRVRRLAQYVLDDSRWFPNGRQETRTATCYAAMLLSSLMRLGYGEHPVICRSTRELARRVVADDGISCQPMDYSLLPRCHMALPKLLLCFTGAPMAKRPAEIQAAIDLVVGLLLEREIHIWVPALRRRWEKLLESAPKRPDLPRGQTVKGWIAKKRQAFISRHGLDDREPRKGWLRFGFPLGYNSDVLEAMYALSLAGVAMTKKLERPLKAIRNRMRPDGTWVMENSLNGKMLVDVEEKGRPSKWLTYRGLCVLRHFGL